MTTPPGLPTSDRWDEIEPLLDAALALTPGQRSSFLEHACGSDLMLRHELEEMAAEVQRDADRLAARSPRRSDASDADFGALREELKDRYEIEREIGRGGMATVFLARDLRHDRPVALKALRESYGASLGSERFMREIAIAARMSHPNVLPLYDSGEVQGIRYYVMPVVTEGSLRDRLRAEPQLPIGECVRIASEVCGALDYAHKLGVVHRDIKPENILLQEGRPLIADFGIARAVSEVAASTLTPASTSLGTPTYMSPEQATDSHDIDGRADLYAVGCVVYEMLTGQSPYGGPTVMSVIAQHVAAAIPSARTLRQTVSPALDTVVRRAMAKSPVDRYATGEALARALREAASGAVVAPLPSDHASIAVLPFVNLSSDPEN